MTHEGEDPALPQARAGARSWQGRERTSQREDAEDEEERARDGDQQPENAEERFHRPRPVDADEAAPGDRPAKQELQHDPALAARTEFGKPRSAGHRQRSSLRPKQPSLLSARAATRTPPRGRSRRGTSRRSFALPAVARTRPPGLSSGRGGADSNACRDLLEQRHARRDRFAALGPPPE